MTRYALDWPGSDSALGFALTQSGTVISGNNDNPSALIIRPTYHASSLDYQVSYAFKITAITTDQIDTRINMIQPVYKWDGGCSGGSSV